MENVAMNEMGLDYELSENERRDVRERYPKVYFPDPILEPLYFGRRDKKRYEGKKVIVDQAFTGNGAMAFGICSDSYKVVRYEDIVHMIENSVGQLTDYGKIQVCPHTYLEGARLKIGIRFPDMASAIRAVDSIIPKVDVFSSLDLSTKLKGMFGAWQLKCLNGMGIWKSMAQFSKRHLQNLFLNNLGETISGGLAIFGTQVDSWKNWASTQISKDIYDEIWDELPFSAAEKIKIEALPEIGTNLLLSNAVNSSSLDLWSLNSILTQWNTHEVKSELRRIDLEPVIARVMERTYSRAIGGRI